MLYERIEYKRRVYKSTEYKMLILDKFSFYAFDADVKEEPGSYRFHYSKTCTKAL